MPHPNFTIESDVARELLRLTLTGDWTHDIVTLFEADVLRALKRMAEQGARPGHFLTLVDVRHKRIVPQTVAGDLARLIRPDSPSKRIALITSSVLHKLQAKRVADVNKYAFFDTEEAGLIWLFDGDHEAVAIHMSATATA